MKIRKLKAFFLLLMEYTNKNNKRKRRKLFLNKIKHEVKIIDTENNNNKMQERKEKQRKLNEILKWIFNSQLVE